MTVCESNGTERIGGNVNPIGKLSQDWLRWINLKMNIVYSCKNESISYPTYIENRKEEEKRRNLHLNYGFPQCRRYNIDTPLFVDPFSLGRFLPLCLYQTRFQDKTSYYLDSLLQSVANFYISIYTRNFEFPLYVLVSILDIENCRHCFFFFFFTRLPLENNWIVLGPFLLFSLYVFTLIFCVLFYHHTVFCNRVPFVYSSI